MSNVGKTIKKAANKVIDTVTAPFKAPAAPAQPSPAAQVAAPPPPVYNMPEPQIIQVPGPTPEEAPRNKRMPNATDRDLMAAGQRARAAAMRRRGRQSTILTDSVKDKLG